MKLWVLGTGSAGNAVLIEAGAFRVLIDAGFTVREMASRLAAAGVAPESVDAVVVTHEHSDHVKGVCACAKRWGWTVYASTGTAVACAALRGGDVRSFEAGGSLTLGEIEIQTVPIPHDAAEPVAVVATARRTGVRVGVIYDLGHASAAVRRAVGMLDLLVLEANHDEGMLRTGPYPPSVRDRIGGSRGHLSNRAAASLAHEATHRGLAHLVLGHLSDRCNDPKVAHQAVASALGAARFRGALHISSQSAVLGPLSPGTRQRVSAIQLSLEL